MNFFVVKLVFCVMAKASQSLKSTDTILPLHYIGCYFHKKYLYHLKNTELKHWLELYLESFVIFFNYHLTG